MILSYNNVKDERYKLMLNSLFRQEYNNYQVIYIDDASPDKTGEVVQNYVNEKAPHPEKFKIVINK